VTAPIQLHRQTYRCKCGFEITGLASKGVIVGRPDMGQWRSLCYGNAEEPFQCRYLRVSVPSKLRQAQVAPDLGPGE
jgi:hypothetical protein